MEEQIHSLLALISFKNQKYSPFRGRGLGTKELLHHIEKVLYNKTTCNFNGSTVFLTPDS